jgi:hypothetical protein
MVQAVDRFLVSSPRRVVSMPPQSWYRLTLAVFAVWRVTHLLAQEDGPWDAIVAVRLRLGNGFLGSLMDCSYCLSLWIAVPPAYMLMSGWREWPLLWLGLSGAACVLEQMSDSVRSRSDRSGGEK